MSDYQVRENSYQKKESELPEQRNRRGLDLTAAEYAKGMLFADSFPWEKSFKKGGRKGKTQILRREVQSLASNLIGDMIGMTYRCRFDCKMTMEYVSDGCLYLTGYSAEDVIQNKRISFGDMLHPVDRITVWNQIDIALQGRMYIDISFRIITKDGYERWVRELGYGVPATNGDDAIFEGIIFDVTDRQQSELRVQRQIKRFEALRHIDLAIASNLDLHDTMTALLEQVIVNLNVDAADVMRVDPITKTLECIAKIGFRTSYRQGLASRSGDGFAERVFLERSALHLGDINHSSESNLYSQRLRKEGFVAYFGLPLITNGQVKGVLQIYHRRPLSPDQDWINFLEALAGQAAIALDNKTMMDQFQRSSQEISLAYDATLEGWSKALELRDQDTQGHTRRVTKLTVRLARAMKVNEEDLIQFRRGALLHDIGKMAIPDGILLKAGPLCDSEWEVMRKHPVYAYELLSGIDFLRPALDIPYCHHEKWDGSGYPRGIKGEEIPLAARIFAIVDVWDALLSERPYRHAWSKAAAINYIWQQSGKHFDPMIVNVFFALVSEDDDFPEIIS